MSDQAEVAEVPVIDESAEVQPAEEYSFAGEDQEPVIEPVAESAPASEDHHDKKSNGVQERFNKMTAEKYELKDELSAQSLEIKRLQDQIAGTAQPEPVAQPSKAKLPDSDLQYDDPEAYVRQVDAYNRSVAESVYTEQAQKAEQLRQQQDQQAQQSKLREGFLAKSNELGISEEEALGSITTLNQRGATEQLGLAITHHDKAPAIAAYLAKNPAVFDEINMLSMSNPIGAAQKLLAIETEAVTRNISSAPPPNTNLSGLSAREPDEFEKACPGAEFT